MDWAGEGEGRIIGTYTVFEKLTCLRSYRLRVWVSHTVRVPSSVGPIPWLLWGECDREIAALVSSPRSPASTLQARER